MLCKASLYSFNVPITNKPNVALTEKNIILIINVNSELKKKRKIKIPFLPSISNVDVIKY